MSLKYGFSISGDDLVILRSMAIQVSYWTADSFLREIGTTEDREAEVSLMFRLGQQACAQAECNQFLLGSLKYHEDKCAADETLKLTVSQMWYEWLNRVVWYDRLDPDHQNMIAKIAEGQYNQEVYAATISRLRRLIGAATVIGGDIAQTMPTPAGAH